ncbi:uncharacterized protein LOC134834785 isoform X2 [Culicoides brevitarsis]|uniref:uncharacterized protein LOC134834785 isoform X2 n=1 Tax=Culicoides brevitarsis TaxID=469753 RepID=UPI00307C2D18
MKRSKRLSAKMSAKDSVGASKRLKTTAKSPATKEETATDDETKAAKVIKEERKEEDPESVPSAEKLEVKQEKIEEDEKKVKNEEEEPKVCFDYCDVVARRIEPTTTNITEDNVKIKEEILDDGNSIEIGEPKIHQEEIAIIVPTKTKHHIETPSDDESGHNLLDLEDDSNNSLLDDELTSAKNQLSLSKSNNDDESTTNTTISIENFMETYEQMIVCRNAEKKTSQYCSFMETYGFIMTFRCVYEVPKHKRDRDSEQAINILLARYTGIDNLDVLQVLLEALNMIGDLEEYQTFGLEPVDCILITFLQLKVCVSFKDVAKVFKCEEKVAATCFVTMLRKIRKMLKSVIYWPTREETEMTIPKFFKPAYSNVRTIFTNLQVQTTGEQKQRFVIGFAPSGFVSYISAGYNADTYSDEKIFRAEKLRQRFERNQDALMVLYGFPIENLLGVSNFRVFRPPFIVKKVLPDNKTILKKKQTKLTAKKVLMNT